MGEGPEYLAASLTSTKLMREEAILAALSYFTKDLYRMCMRNKE